MIPNLQALGRARLSEEQRQAEYQVMHPIEQVPCDTYFFDPTTPEMFEWLVVRLIPCSRALVVTVV